MMEVTTHPKQLVDHLFRHEAGKMISVLTRIFGLHNLQLAEDVVQETFLKALQLWKYNSLPSNPSAWLMQVAKNKAVDIVRRGQKQCLFSDELAGSLEATAEQTIEQFFLDTEIADSQLSMIFTCCHPSLNPEDQVALTLKTVSGFGVQEIAKALVSNPATIQKRLYRAKEYIKKEGIKFRIPVGHSLQQRLDPVYTIIYLLFNEGYNSIKADELIRYDLCAEAMRLCRLLAEHRFGSTPRSFALLSLMCFQTSRFDSRIDENSSIILLEKQDRSKWNHELIQLGYHYLNQSSTGSQLSVYHIESAIAAEHCLAPSFEATDWERMLTLYDLLLAHKPTPVVRLNRAIILSQLNRLPEAIQAIRDISRITELLEHHYMYGAVLGDLYRKAGNTREARAHLEKACELTSSIAEKRLLREKLEGLG